MVKKARDMGLTVPVVLMGYYNPFLQYRIERLCKDTKEAGGDGFIVVYLPPEEGVEIASLCTKHGMSNIPLIAPTLTDQRIKYLSKSDFTFLYCISVTGTTGGSAGALPPDLKDYIGRVRSKTDLPLAIGFRISTPQMLSDIANLGDGVVVGSAILRAMDKVAEDGGSTKDRKEAVRAKVADLTAGCKQGPGASHQATALGRIPDDYDTASFLSSVDPPSSATMSISLRIADPTTTPSPRLATTATN